MLIRAAAPGDIPQMMALAEQSETAAHWGARDYEALFAPRAARRIALVAEQQPRTIGGFVVVRCGIDEWEIENVIVRPSARRHGIAQSLIAQVQTQAQNDGAAAVLLEVRESNVAARALYGKLGFREEGRRRNYYREADEDAVMLRLVL